MKNLRYSLAVKLYSSFALALLVTILVSCFAVYQVRKIDSALKEANLLAEQALGPLYVAREALDQTGIAARNAYIFREPSAAKRELDEVDRQKRIYLDVLPTLDRTISGKPEFAAVREGLNKMAVELQRPRRYLEAGDHEGFGKFLVEECSPLRRKIVSDIDVLLTGLQNETKEASAAAQANGSSAQLWIVILTGVCACVSALVSTMITRQLLRQLGGEPAYAMEVASKIAEGNLRVSVQLKDGDRDSVILAMSKMQRNLAEIVTKVRAGTDSIASASSEIASGNTDLSSRTEQQAVEVGRVNTVMKALLASITDNANSAHEGSSVAATATKVSLEGGAAVESVVATMGLINEASRKIVDIISVIDGIAFQTNILALNAAVEAARAGDQGRGFAVVASEVRSLAQRSAVAAKEIKALIEDSVDKVQNGTQVVENAGATMKQVVEHIQHVATIMVAITNATTEQTHEVALVDKAIGNLDDMTLQNTALVEEAAAAAQSLQEQAQELSSLVATFKVDGPHS